MPDEVLDLEEEAPRRYAYRRPGVLRRAARRADRLAGGPKGVFLAGLLITSVGILLGALVLVLRGGFSLG